jgi:ABC-2 type transport system permease protein
VLLFGSVLRNDVREIRVVVVDPAPDAETLRIRARIEATDLFRIVAAARSVAEVEPLFQRNAADVAIALESGFARAIAGGDAARVLIVADASDPNFGTMAQSYLTAVLGGADAGIAGPIRSELRMRFNPTLESVNLFVPGLISLVLTMVSAMMTAISLSREKERGTLEILLVSPLRPAHIIVGKVAPYLLLGLANALTALGAAWLVFGVPFRGSVLLLIAEALLYTLVSLALGVLIGANAPSQRIAMLIAMVGTMLPNALLSGMIFPIASMPEVLQPVTNIVPARWFIVIARGIMLKGVGLEYLWRETLVLAAMALVLVALSVRRFKPRLG